jgi:hypothetical protein
MSCNYAEYIMCVPQFLFFHKVSLLLFINTSFLQIVKEKSEWTQNWLLTVIEVCFGEWVCLFVFVATTPQWAKVSSFTRFLDHTQRRTTVGRTPLDEWSPRRRDLYLTTHNPHNRQTSIPPVGSEPKTPPGDRPRTYALDREATGIG